MIYPHIQLIRKNNRVGQRYYYNVVTHLLTEHLLLVDYVRGDRVIKDSVALTDIREALLTTRIYKQERGK